MDFHTPPTASKTEKPPSEKLNIAGNGIGGVQPPPSVQPPPPIEEFLAASQDLEEPVLTSQPTPLPTPPIEWRLGDELQEIRRALEQNNEHLKSIRVYIGWFWWILIGIPLILIIFGVWMIAFNSK
jgi:hypothetical protein